VLGISYAPGPGDGLLRAATSPGSTVRGRKEKAGETARVMPGPRAPMPVTPRMSYEPGPRSLDSRLVGDGVRRRMEKDGDALRVAAMLGE
jgi:hypothetical protein